MQDRFDTYRFASHGRPRRTRQRGPLIGVGAWIGIATVLIGVGFAAAQDMSMAPVADEMGTWDAGGPPVTSMGEGSYFSQDLGTTLRTRFNTRSYGQDDDQNGNLDIGSMQVVSFEDSIAFLDGQVTLSDVQGVGFNVGIGYRWLSYLPYATDAQRITGVSLWGDGSSTEANNFFPQLGVSFESLGDIWDLRANGYIPIGQDNQVGHFVPTGVIGFQSNFISELSIATVDHSFYAAEAELARRLGHERDAWGFAGSYVLANDEQDTVGYRAGVRGYAYPDLLLQIAVSHDDIFDDQHHVFANLVRGPHAHQLPSGLRSSRSVPRAGDAQRLRGAVAIDRAGRHAVDRYGRQRVPRGSRRQQRAGRRRRLVRAPA